MQFQADSLDVGPIREDQDYGGVRILLLARVTTAKVRLQVDVGFGDAITPDAIEVEFPALLDFPAPRLRAYPRETVVAEKLEAMVKLGLANSRMKDFYDLSSSSGCRVRRRASGARHSGDVPTPRARRCPTHCLSR